jgi:hypothetical protein
MNWRRLSERLLLLMTMMTRTAATTIPSLKLINESKVLRLFLAEPPHGNYSAMSSIMFRGSMLIAWVGHLGGPSSFLCAPILAHMLLATRMLTLSNRYLEHKLDQYPYLFRSDQPSSTNNQSILPTADLLIRKSIMFPHLTGSRLHYSRPRYPLPGPVARPQHPLQMQGEDGRLYNVSSTKLRC